MTQILKPSGHLSGSFFRRFQRVGFSDPWKGVCVCVFPPGEVSHYIQLDMWVVMPENGDIMIFSDFM